jgi:UDP-2,4-diacetamido-2,4,6-trideoxy-beta-L-altropyranose hydrolase
LKPIVYFRADGNSQIGLGHVVRSLAVAGMIQEDFECKFIIRDPSSEIKKQILEVCTEIIELKPGIANEAELISGEYISKNDIIVLDGYNFDAQYQKAFKEAGAKLICIDDLHQIHFVADAVINHASGINAELYSSEYYTRFYLGTDYSLLRAPFLEAAKTIRKVDKIESLFICMGGADPDNRVLDILRTVREMSIVKKINVIVGSSYSYEDFLKEFAKDPNIQIYRNLSAEELARLMKESDAAICSASTISYEYCAVGGKLFIVKTFDNQQLLYDFLIKEKLALDFNKFKEKIKEPADEEIANQRRFFNGRSSDNIKRIFNTLIIEDKVNLRKAVETDCKLFFDWANDPIVRKNSINKEPIKWEDHEKWFYQKLKNKNTHLFLFSIENDLFGQLRFDKVQDYWLISFSLDKNYRGMGLAEVMVHKSMVEMKRIINSSFVLKAQVWDQNIASANIFKNLNFKMEDPQIINSEKFNNFIKYC